ncbi:MAG TPA: methyl-accepting chemotaxis protein [Oligoflexus sp.]|uniref:methyl-accepting chemotaxis protein n=1 Tax=Oligoflexus sp. TaxID=1971216 RepID=UPI002D359B7B|nr:methyl-accepting chemotaxis protein [Oligoflexus sp.]HYX34704.1 methyl-accepting chemotaxis protein [Oligoflexus sp.]
MRILSRFRNLPMQAKTFWSLGIIGGLSLSGMGLGFLCSRIVAADYAHMVNSNSRLEVLSIRIADHIHRVSRDEFAYIMKRDQAMIERRKESLSHVFEDISEVKALDQDVIPRTQVESFESEIKSYQTYFDVISQRLVEEGDASSGYLGELRVVAHSMEKILKENKSPDQPRVMVSYLTIRRHEKDYLARRERSYIDKMDQEITFLEKFLKNNSHFKPEERAGILSGAAAYKEKLGLINNGYTDLMAQRQKQEGALQNIENFIIKVNEQVRIYNNAHMNSLQTLVSTVNFIFLGAAILTVLVIILSTREFSALTRSLIDLSHIIRSSGEKNLKASVSLQSTSEKTSTAVSEQASAIQETVSTINEISAMVDKSVESANMSAQKAEMSLHISTEGKASVANMREAMEAIQGAMSGMIDQNQAGNQRMVAMLSIIEKIAERTQVINEIVFQTKLLSFNASVEAARAGENGRGFSIVAEEVGTLARMSGESARAITELLRTSRAEVAAIIEESRGQTERLSQAGADKVAVGMRIANRCEEILSEVVEHVSSVKALMGEISSAAREEADGIHNITTAMNELDETTAINSNMAHETMTLSSMLNREAQTLNRAVLNLSGIVLGQNHSVAAQPDDREAPADFDEDDHDEESPKPLHLAS